MQTSLLPHNIDYSLFLGPADHFIPTLRRIRGKCTVTTTRHPKSNMHRV